MTLMDILFGDAIWLRRRSSLSFGCGYAVEYSRQLELRQPEAISHGLRLVLSQLFPGLSANSVGGRRR